MKKHLMLFLSGMALLQMSASGRGLTIVPTFDVSITSDPNGAAMTNAIYTAINALESKIADNFTVYIHYTSDSTTSLGQSSTYISEVSYPAYISALKKNALGANDMHALSHLTNSTSVDPITGQATIYTTLALARHLGLDTGTGPDGFDSTVSLNMTLMNLTRPPLSQSKYDLVSTVEHEQDEVLGISSSLPNPANTYPISPIDLFRYTSTLARTYITTGDNAYFSVDGTNLWARFNMDADGDYSDFWSSTGSWWAPLGITAAPQTQDAFAFPGKVVNLGTNELAMLDVVGWTLASNVAGAVQTSPSLIAAKSSGHITFSWTNAVVGFSLQESTNLTTWSTSSTGTNNPAVISTTGANVKFYRLVGPSTAPGANIRGQQAPVDKKAHAVRVHVTNPSAN